MDRLKFCSVGERNPEPKMMNVIKSLFIALLIAGWPAAAEHIPGKPEQGHNLHNHSAQHGGFVFMAGQDHVEVVRQGSELSLQITDNKRHPLSWDAFNLELTLFEASGSERK